MPGKASTYHPNGIKPQIGDEIIGTEIGRNSRGIFIWQDCPDCGLERWVGRHAPNKLCMSCAAVRRNLVGDKNPRWKGGVRQGKDGYRYISVPEDHRFIKMAGRIFIRGKYRYYIAEHRLVMAQHIGRPLEFWELVHHINGIKFDNRIENLEILTHKKHLPSMSVQRKIAEMEARITLLEAENVLLRSLLDGGRDSVPPESESATL